VPLRGPESDDAARAELGRILAEQRAARAALAAGDETRGARLWIADAVAEEVLMLAEGE